MFFNGAILFRSEAFLLDTEAIRFQAGAYVIMTEALVIAHGALLLCTHAFAFHAGALLVKVGALMFLKGAFLLQTDTGVRKSRRGSRSLSLRQLRGFPHVQVTCGCSFRVNRMSWRNRYNYSLIPG